MIDCYIQNQNGIYGYWRVYSAQTMNSPAIKQGRQTVLLGRKGERERELRLTSKRKCFLLNT